MRLDDHAATGLAALSVGNGLLAAVNGLDGATIPAAGLAVSSLGAAALSVLWWRHPEKFDLGGRLGRALSVLLLAGGLVTLFAGALLLSIALAQ